MTAEDVVQQGRACVEDAFEGAEAFGQGRFQPAATLQDALLEGCDPLAERAVESAPALRDGLFEGSQGAVELAGDLRAALVDARRRACSRLRGQRARHLLGLGGEGGHGLASGLDDAALDVLGAVREGGARLVGAEAEGLAGRPGAGRERLARARAECSNVERVSASRSSRAAVALWALASKAVRVAATRSSMRPAMRSPVEERPCSSDSELTEMVSCSFSPVAARRCATPSPCVVIVSAIRLPVSSMRWATSSPRSPRFGGELLAGGLQGVVDLHARGVAMVSATPAPVSAMTRVTRSEPSFRVRVRISLVCSSVLPTSSPRLGDLVGQLRARGGEERR